MLKWVLEIRFSTIRQLPELRIALVASTPSRAVSPHSGYRLVAIIPEDKP